MRPSAVKMAGHNHSLHMDPSLVKYANLYVNRHQFFRWNARTARLTFIWMAAVPGLVGYMAYTTDGKWDFRGKRRGDTIAEF